MTRCYFVHVRSPTTERVSPDTRRVMRLPNNAMQLTKPAQATELRS